MYSLFLKSDKNNHNEIGKNAIITNGIFNIPSLSLPRKNYFRIMINSQISKHQNYNPRCHISVQIILPELEPE